MRRVQSFHFWMGPLVALCCFHSSACFGERGLVLVQVQDVGHKPVARVEIGIDGFGGAQLTGSDGKAKLALPDGSRAGDWLTLSVLHSPRGRDLVMVSPWDNRAQIPSFEKKTENFIPIVVVERADRVALENRTVVKALLEKINKANSVKKGADPAEEDRKANLLAVAKQYGLTAEAVDHAIREFGSKGDDPYDRGLAYLYALDYPKASANLASSLQQREDTLAAAQNDVADAAFFLGASQYRQGLYRESVETYRKCFSIRVNDPAVMNNLALSLQSSGDYAAAEPLYKKALEIEKKSLGSDDPAVAIVLDNFAQLLRSRGEYDEAEPLFREALLIKTREFGPDHREVALTLNSLAGLLKSKGEYERSEALYQRALTILENVLGPNDPVVAIVLDNLGGVLEITGSYGEAEQLYRRALRIEKTALGPNHLDVARTLNNLASLMRIKGNYEQAEALFRRTLAIEEKALGPDHPEVAYALDNLAGLLRVRGDYDGAEALRRRALAIEEKALGPEHPDVAITLDNLAGLLQGRGKLDDAEPIYRRALAIKMKTLGLDHPDVADTLNNLADLLAKKGDNDGARLLYRRALAIDEKALGPEHPNTKTIAGNLKSLQETAASAH